MNFGFDASSGRKQLLELQTPMITGCQPCLVSTRTETLALMVTDFPYFPMRRHPWLMQWVFDVLASLLPSVAAAAITDVHMEVGRSGAQRASGTQRQGQGGLSRPSHPASFFRRVRTLEGAMYGTILTKRDSQSSLYWYRRARPTLRRSGASRWGRTHQGGGSGPGGTFRSTAAGETTRARSSGFSGTDGRQGGTGHRATHVLTCGTLIDVRRLQQITKEQSDIRGGGQHHLHDRGRAEQWKSKWPCKMELAKSVFQRPLF